MLKKLLIAILILITALWLMGYNTQDVKNLPQLYSAYSSLRSYSSMSTAVSNTKELQSIATSFNRVIINSNSSTAYMIYKNNTYFVIRSETTYVIGGKLAIEIYDNGSDTITTVTMLPTNFKEMNIVDKLVTYYHNTSNTAPFTCTGELFFLAECPTSVTYSVKDSMTFFYIDNSITITLLPSSAAK